MTAIVVPIWCQNPDTLAMLLSAAESWRQQSQLVAYCPTNRLHGISAVDLQSQLIERSGQSVRVLHEDFVERTVAGAWNYGLKMAIEDGHKDFVVTAMDVFWHPYAIDRLVQVGRPMNNAIVSGVEERQADGDGMTEGADFSGVYLSDVTLKKFGWVCPEYSAYHEDNDYAAQVWSLGGDTLQAHSVQFFHHGSGTIKTDAEAAHHVQHWFGINKRLFVQRWGAAPAGTKSEAMAQYDFGRPKTIWSYEAGLNNDWKR